MNSHIQYDTIVNVNDSFTREGNILLRDFRELGLYAIECRFCISDVTAALTPTMLEGLSYCMFFEHQNH